MSDVINEVLDVQQDPKEFHKFVLEVVKCYHCHYADLRSSESEFSWFNKAMAWNSDELVDIVEGFDPSPYEKKIDYSMALHGVINDYSFGWGTNWSDDVHNASMAKIYWFINQLLYPKDNEGFFRSEIPGILKWSANPYSDRLKKE